MLSKFFDKRNSKNQSFLIENPLLIATEREKYALQQGLEVYRVMYVRNHKNFNY